MTHEEAFKFVQSIQSLSVDLFNSLNKLDWNDCADTLDLIQGDTEALTKYVNKQLQKSEATGKNYFPAK